MALKVGPPSRVPKDLSKQFAADPFNPQMRVADKGPLRHTSLGLLVEIWNWYRMHQISCGRAFYPVAESVRQHLMIECPEVVKDIQRIDPE